MFFLGSQSPVIEKDPVIQKLKQEVTDRMWDIIKQEETVSEKTNDTIKFVSFEDALKELSSIRKS